MSGAVTRREIIEDEAILWGKEYADNVEKAKSKNKEFIESVLALNDANLKLRASRDDKEYQQNQKAANEIGEKAVTIWKEQNQAELALISTKKKNELATESTNKALIKERTLLSETNKEIKLQVIANGALESAYKKLSAQVTLAGNKVKDIISTGRLASETQAQYNQRLAVAQKEFDKLNSRVRAADAAVGQFNRNVGNYPQAAFDGIKKLVEAFGLVTGIQLFVSVMKDAFTTVRDFEKEIVNLAAISGKSRAEIAPLEAKIREVAKSSINGATDVAKLATELIKLGSTTDEAEKLLEPVNNLSVALQATAEDSATLVKSILNAYGEGAQEAGRVTDILAESANRSALDFQGLRDSFSYLAPAARALGIPIEKTAAIIGTLADNGIKAESAGRLTSTAFARLASQGLTLEDALTKINKAQKDGSSQLEVLSLASDLFGAEAGKIGLILANNTEKIKDSTLAYENSEGALKSLTDKQLKSLDSELKILSSAWEDYILDTNEASGASSNLSGVVRFLSGNLKTILSILGYATLAWGAYKTQILLANAQKRLLALTTTQATTAQAANTTATVAGTGAQTANTVATTGATTAWERFNMALKANALLLIISALVAAVYYIDKFNKSLSEVNSETKKGTEEFLKSREEISKTAISTKTLTDRYDELKSKTKLNKEEQKELNEIVKSLSKTYPDAVTKINKYGDAVEVNTAKIKAFTKAQKEANDAKAAVEIQKNTKLLADLQKEQKRLNKSTVEDANNRVDIFTKEGKLYKVEYAGRLTSTRELTLEEKAAFKQKVADNEKAIADTKARLKALNGLTEAEKEAAKTSDEATQKKVANAPRTIEVIDAEIKAQEELIKKLSDKSGKEGRIIKAKIAALTAEREQIYSTAKAEKDKQDNGLKNAKKVNDALYQLSQFRYQNEINNNQKIIDSEKATTEEKINALLEIQQIQESKNNDTLKNDLLKFALEKDGLEDLTKEKFALYQKDAKNRVDSIVSGKIATEKLTNEEKLILEKYYAEKKNLEEKGAKDKQSIVDSEVDIIQKKIDAELLAQDTKLQKTIKSENEIYSNALEGAKDNFELIQQAEEEHQRRLLEIKKDFAKQGLKIQIDELQKLLDDDATKEESARVSAKERAEIENKLAKIKAELSTSDVEQTEEDAKKKVELEKAANQRIKELAFELKDALVSFANSIFDAKIANIDAEIQANDEYYNREIEAAGNNEALKTLLENERERKRVALEKKKRKAEYDAAVFNKIMSIATIAAQTAMASAAAIAPPPVGLGPVFGGSLLPYIIGLGAIQTATVLAAPLPKYKTGRKSGPEEDAIVGDGYVSEVITGTDGSNPRITPAKPTIAHLGKDDIVWKSWGEYQKYKRNSQLKAVQEDSNKLSKYQYYIDNGFTDERINKKLDEVVRAIKRNKPLPESKNIDLGHELWRLSNINWRA